jgi:hypothetical protein
MVAREDRADEAGAGGKEAPVAAEYPAGSAEAMGRMDELVRTGHREKEEALR